MRIDSDIELIDELTNVVMDIIRRKFNIDPDSDEDDELYGEIHDAIESIYREGLVLVGQEIYGLK